MHMPTGTQPHHVKTVKDVPSPLSDIRIQSIMENAGGGFLTGWKGVALAASVAAVAAGLAATAYVGSEANRTVLAPASTEQLDLNGAPHISD